MMIADQYSFLRKTSESAEPPISVEAAKKALRIQHGLEDDVLARKLLAAEELTLERTRRVLRPSDFELSLKAATWAPVCLKVCPVRDVASVEWRSAAGNWTAAPDNAFEFFPSYGGGELVLLSAFQPQDVEAERANLRVKFSAGYGDAGEGDDVDPELKLPARVVELILLLAGHWFEHREAVTSGDLAEVPLGADMLFKELRNF